ncbi:hypothetical protein DSCO28_57520 [Desulfosarcina ovata subsp. sediminis]|uniref:Uncharacterized protein n=2 Tax=Desulfosarcina ovata TaxID=83564 RepID=A0A5K8AGZ0_9BACT|nr:hypothetical protein DSCO28_57520 [Desulfosarcina ovata subsp. sediminis]BBO91942.1 hypothetical protein DSCOOX_51220 [Desulfosarcina ovata subsp. ovata]
MVYGFLDSLFVDMRFPRLVWVFTDRFRQAPVSLLPGMGGRESLFDINGRAYILAQLQLLR